MTGTTIVITDATLLAQIVQASGVCDIADASGNVVATFERVPFGLPPSGYKIPFWDEELERRRQVRTGRPLADILRDLVQGGGQ